MTATTELHTAECDALIAAITGDDDALDAALCRLDTLERRRLQLACLAVAQRIEGNRDDWLEGEQ